MAGDCCHRQGRGGNVCGFAKQEKVNSAGALVGNLGNFVLGRHRCLVRKTFTELALSATVGLGSMHPGSDPGVRIICRMCELEVRTVECNTDTQNDIVVDERSLP